MTHQRYRSYRPLELTKTEFELFESLTRRRFLIGAGALGLGALAGCGAPGASAPTAMVTTRRVTDAQGNSVDVPVRPARIVAFNLAGSLLALNVTPVGVVTFERDQFAFSRQLENTTAVGSAAEGGFNLETVAGLAPDLILVTDGYGLDQYDLLQAIAPTLVITDPQVDFRQTVRDLGAALDLKEQAVEGIAAFDMFAAAGRAEAQRLVGDETVALVNVRETVVLLYGIKQGYSGPTLYGELGMRPAALVQELIPEDSNIELSLEVIPQLDADRLFLLAGVGAKAQVEAFQQQPLWQRLPAVQAGRVALLTGDYWYSSSLIAQERKIQDVITALGGTAPPGQFG